MDIDQQRMKLDLNNWCDHCKVPIDSPGHKSALWSMGRSTPQEIWEVNIGKGWFLKVKFNYQKKELMLGREHKSIHDKL